MSKNKPALTHKHIVITGGSSGIGAALALEYAAPGVQLSLCGRNMERLKAVAEQCAARGAIVSIQKLDVSDAKAARKLVESCAGERPIDLIIANAGISGGTGGVPDGEDEAQVRRIFAVNLDGVLNTVIPVQEVMQKQGYGQIAIMSSLAGYRGWPGAPAYCASKAAVKVYGESLRGALAPAGIKVNVICPGFVSSRMTDANDFAMPMKWPADKAARYIKRKLAANKGRIAFPWPVALALWLVAALPDGAAQTVLRAFPSKKSI